MNEYTEEGCLSIVEAAFTKGLQKTKSREEVNVRLNFVNNSPLFKLYCFLAEKNYNLLKTLTTVRNHKFLKECKRK
jgi:hypothetical protein